ncbi:conserved hypothetical protein [Methanococcus vannielii SB]|uniref:MFS family permease n=1 Tax=Methanococcus vannielii (strain ATCC 35089 / DSM 1224 / JCM 13029 / OCM 148 / SB) TaxID=406327 RepID=A6UQP8_METVS|nr:DUF4013 domain-containing protein [Methanococcus vannielii]ABR54820.1 conserved hypothetical protein [Methanococcus vannielii SB]
MFFEKYIKEPLIYASSDFKKIFVGGVLQLVSIFTIILGLFLMVAGVIPSIMGMMNLAIITSIVGIVLGLLISIIGVLVLAVVSGYYVKIIRETIDGKMELPEWGDFKELLKKGATLLMGMFVLQLAFGIISVIISSPFIILSILNESAMNSIAIDLALNLISFVISIFQALYLTLAMITYVDKDKFSGFFDLKEIVSKISLEYVLVLLLVGIVSFILVVPVILVTMIPIIMGAIISPILMAVAMGIMVLTMPFLQMFLTAFGYRSYTNYYIERKNKY